MACGCMVDINSARSRKRLTPTCRCGMWSALTEIAFVDDAEVMAGLGSVPLGRWHGPGRHARSVPVPQMSQLLTQRAERARCPFRVLH